MYELPDAIGAPPVDVLYHDRAEDEFALRVTVPFPHRDASKAVVFPEPIIACTGILLLSQLRLGTNTYQS